LKALAVGPSENRVSEKTAQGGSFKDRRNLAGLWSHFEPGLRFEFVGTPPFVVAEAHSQAGIENQVPPNGIGVDQLLDDS
jgi:hypothetical protein